MTPEKFLKTPILFIIFNQPEVTKIVFEAIRNARPQKLFIAADGPRKGKPEDIRECLETRNIVRHIDWECQVYQRFHEVNIGCRENVSSAITWFLAEVGEGIILEYDCLPHPTFFKYCEILLERYRHDHRVFSICGADLQFGQKYGDGDYYFARLPCPWGWATWQRAWKHWDGDVKSLPKFISERQIDNYFQNRKVKNHLLEKFSSVFYGINKTTWGFGWVYAHLALNRLTIFPKTNLISNLGFGKKAAHATNSDSIFASVPTIGLHSLSAPTFEIPWVGADEAVVLLAEKRPLQQKIKEICLKIIKYVLPGKIVRILKTMRFTSFAQSRIGPKSEQ